MERCNSIAKFIVINDKGKNKRAKIHNKFYTVLFAGSEDVLVC